MRAPGVSGSRSPLGQELQEFRSSEVAEAEEFVQESPVGLDCTRVRDKKLGNLFQQNLQVCCYSVS